MNFDFSGEPKHLRGEARKFLSDRFPLASARRILDGAETFDRGLWRELA
jgi:hypothetical protein